MNWHQFAYMTIGALVFAAGSAFFASATDKQVPEGNKEAIMDSIRADSPKELAIQLNSLFSASRIGELDRLASAKNCTVALAAGWERVRRTVPEAKHGEIVSPDAKAIARFLGLIEGR